MNNNRKLIIMKMIIMKKRNLKNIVKVKDLNKIKKREVF